MTRPPEKTPDLSLDNTLQEGLRALFVLGADGLQLEGEQGIRVFFSKENLIVLLERGLGEEPLGTLLRHPEWCRPYREARGRLSPEMRIIRLGPGGESGVVTSQNLEAPTDEDLPNWWAIPLPLLAQQNGQVALNLHGKKLFPEGQPTVDDVRRALAQDHLMPWPGTNGIKTVLLVPLTGDIYLLEDVSSDMELAEDVAWWAASGKALVAYFETQGYRIRPWKGVLPPLESSTEDLLPCQWEGRLVGHLALEAPPKASRRRATKASASPKVPAEVDTSPTSPLEEKKTCSRKKTVVQDRPAEDRHSRTDQRI